MIITLASVAIAAAGASTLGWLGKDTAQQKKIAEEFFEQNKHDLLKGFFYNGDKVVFVGPKDQYKHILHVVVNSTHLSQSTVKSIGKRKISSWIKEIEDSIRKEVKN